MTLSDYMRAGLAAIDEIAIVQLCKRTFPPNSACLRKEQNR